MSSEVDLLRTENLSHRIDGTSLVGRISVEIRSRDAVAVVGASSSLDDNTQQDVERLICDIIGDHLN
jgi:hypothetical protein